MHNVGRQDFAVRCTGQHTAPPPPPNAASHPQCSPNGKNAGKCLAPLMCNRRGTPWPCVALATSVSTQANDSALEAVAKAVGGGYCRLQMPLKLALGVMGDSGWGLGAQCIPGGGGRGYPRSTWFCERIPPHRQLLSMVLRSAPGDRPSQAPHGSPSSSRSSRPRPTNQTPTSWTPTRRPRRCPCGSRSAAGSSWGAAFPGQRAGDGGETLGRGREACGRLALWDAGGSERVLIRGC